MQDLTVSPRVDEIYAGGGETDVMLRLRVADLLQATGGRIVEVT